MIENTQLPETTDFTYLGTIISTNGFIHREIGLRISRAGVAFGQLQDRVYLNRKLKLDTKKVVYRAITLKILLSGVETWTSYIYIYINLILSVSFPYAA